MIAFYWPEAYDDIDWQKGFNFCDKELAKISRQAKTGLRIADKLVAVHLKDGRSSMVMLHLEFQNQVDEKLAERIFTYYYRIRDHYQKGVVNLVIRGDRSKKPNQDLFECDMWGCRLLFQFRVIRLEDWRDRLDTLRTSRNPFALVTLAHLAAQTNHNNPQRRLADKLRLTKLLLSKNFSKAMVQDLFAFIDWVLAMPEELEQQFQVLLTAEQGAPNMRYITSIERSGIKKGREEGREEGRQEGILLGMKKGREEGQAISLASSLRMLLENRFGPLPQNIHQQIQTADLSRLKVWFARSLDANSLQELFG